MKDVIASVIIPVSEDAETLGQCLDGLRRQDFKKMEVIVVCDPRAGEPASLPEGSEDLRVIKERHRRPLGQLVNAGMVAARGHVKVLLRPHCSPIGAGWVRSMVEPFEDETVGAVVSQCLPLERAGGGPASRLLDAVDSPYRRSPEPGLQSLERVSYLCDAYRASLLADVGYFEGDTVAEPAQAIDVSVKLADAGYRIVLSDAAAVSYSPPPARRSVGGVLRKAIGYGRADALLDRLYELRWLNAGVFGAALLSLFLLPLAVVNLPAALVASAVVFIWSAFLSLRIPLLRWEWPLMVFNFAAFVALVVLLRDDWRPDLFGKRVHPAVIRQWCWLAGITGSDMLLVVKAAVGCGWRALRRRRGWLYAGPVFGLGLLWWLLAGAGYLLGRLLPVARKE
jgi:glycosyltransferase involved in cell wall biosynthesis